MATGTGKTLTGLGLARLCEQLNGRLAVFKLHRSSANRAVGGRYQWFGINPLWLQLFATKNWLKRLEITMRPKAQIEGREFSALFAPTLRFPLQTFRLIEKIRGDALLIADEAIISVQHIFKCLTETFNARLAPLRQLSAIMTWRTQILFDYFGQDALYLLTGQSRRRNLRRMKYYPLSRS